MQHADRNITKTGKEENLYIHFVGKIKRFHCCTTPIPPVKKSKLVIVKKYQKSYGFSALGEVNNANYSATMEKRKRVIIKNGERMFFSLTIQCSV